ncbi:MAG: hypothetical protein IKU55_06180, partial [Clostridia bacterium]|nr:hypothetical protein [Clostridia bacterium]
MDCRKTAEEILAAIAAAGADLGECSVASGNTTEIYYESGKISMVRSVISHGASIKVIKNQKKGSVTINTCDSESIRAAVADAMAAAEHAPADEAEGIAELIENKSFASGRKEPDREKLYGLMREFLDSVKAEYPKISFDSVSVGHSYRESIYANSNGVRLESADGENSFSAMFMAKEGELTSSFNSVGILFADDDMDTPLLERGMTRAILAETEQQVVPETLTGKFEGDIIITPACLPDILYYAQAN